jgi:hypothetical protein
LPHPIKTIGDQEVELRLHPQVQTNLKVRIESTTPPPEVTEAPVAEGRDQGRGRGEGRREYGRGAGVKKEEPKTEAKPERKPRGGKPEQA